MDGTSSAAPIVTGESASWYAYFYLMKPDAESVRRAAPEHASYWQHLPLAGYTGGPFADRSGGLIIFIAHGPGHAQSLIDADPFKRQGLLDSLWLKEWVPTASVIVPRHVQ